MALVVINSLSGAGLSTKKHENSTFFYTFAPYMNNIQTHAFLTRSSRDVLF